LALEFLKLGLARPMNLALLYMRESSGPRSNIPTQFVARRLGLYVEDLNETKAGLAFVFFMDCAVSDPAFRELLPAGSGDWLAISAFFTVGRLLINDFF
jgi:hypothetical protein